MSKQRAEILESNSPYICAARIVIDAPAQKIFDLLANPSAHKSFDGSGTLRRKTFGASRLSLGSTFGMAMKIKLPYRIKNTVVEFEENRVIAWSHLMQWRWSYQLREIDEKQTEVIERFDASNVPQLSRWWLNQTKAMNHTPKWIAKSLVQLKAICEG